METVNVLTRPRYVRSVRQLHWWMAALIVLAYLLVDFHDYFPREVRRAMPLDEPRQERENEARQHHHDRDGERHCFQSEESGY